MLELWSTGDVIRIMQDEGYKTHRKHVDRLINTGKIMEPRLVGPTRVWLREDVEKLRSVLAEMKS